MNKSSDNIIRTAEFVTPSHPDKLCDRIADSLLDEYLRVDPQSRVAIEVTGGHSQVFITGEVTSNHSFEIKNVVNEVLGNRDYQVIVNLDKQSLEIAAGVDTGGAGDQGIVIGYACSETPELLPAEYVAARSLCQHLYEKFPYDGKVQITIENNQPIVVVASFQNTPSTLLQKEVEDFVPNANQYIINPAGDWAIGGFDADSGTVGRKLAIDNYGPRVRIGGGAFSGKDLSKTDRSGAYFARHLAVKILNHTDAKEVEVELAFAIGVADPVACNVKIKGSDAEYSLPENMSPRVFIDSLNMNNVSYAQSASWGHFGNNFPWEI